MIFRETNLPGVFTIDLELRSDERGFFARTWCQKEFLDHGLNANLVQCSISLNSKMELCAACITRPRHLRRAS